MISNIIWFYATRRFNGNMCTLYKTWPGDLSDVRRRISLAIRSITSQSYLAFRCYQDVKDIHFEYLLCWKCFCLFYCIIKFVVANFVNVSQTTIPSLNIWELHLSSVLTWEIKVWRWRIWFQNLKLASHRIYSIWEFHIVY